jgi:chemotaxis protein methyltransferase CheR
LLLADKKKSTVSRAGQDFRKLQGTMDRIRAAPCGPHRRSVLCRNLVFTYFAPGLQEALQRAIAARLASGGYLAIGAHERLPAETGDLVPLAPKLPIYRKAPAPA